MGKRTRNIFFAADYHIGHGNVLIYDKRPFADLETMHEGLIKRYNAVVNEQDLCYFLGDMGWKGAKLKEFVDELNGTKVLILGNHDGKTQSMMNSGFDAVLYGATMYIAGQKVTMTHCPLRGVFREDVTGMRGAVEGDNWHRESEHTMFSIRDEGQFHLSGHIHSPNGGLSQKILGRQYDVGLPSSNYAPTSISTIESWIAKTLKEEIRKLKEDWFI